MAAAGFQRRGAVRPGGGASGCLGDRQRAGVEWEQILADA